VLAAGLAAGMLIAPHAYIYDVTALLLPLVIAVQNDQPRSLRIVAFLLIAPVIPMMSLAQPPWSVLPALAVTALLAVLAVTRRARQEAEPAPACDAVRPAAC
jgi:predicted branched-subunit amino acid permease